MNPVRSKMSLTSAVSRIARRASNGMRLPSPDKQPYILACLLSIGVVITTLISIPVLADTKPYFRVNNADVFAGGWFNSNNLSCVVSDINYQASNSNPKLGGILSYATYDGVVVKGAGTNQAAFALGRIEGDSSGKGFYSYSTPTGNNQLSFSNQVAGAWGGVLAGASGRPHCITDYYNTKQSLNPPPSPLPSTNISALDTGQYTAGTGGSITHLSSVNPIAASKNITIFVNGDVYISGNITYADRNTYNSATVPKLAIVVLGNIYLGPNATRLDGLYIAQPDMGIPSPVTANTGNFWTCHENSASAPSANWVSANCRTALNVRGAVIAKKTILLRVTGDVNSGPVAENFEYIPEMVLGQPFFGSAAIQNGSIDSVISLPPVF